jgi:two-component system catabolic regulation response regulator CreB
MPAKPRILVVEDEAAIADAIHYALASDGFEPVCRTSAAEALQEFQAQPPALAILDLGLPDISGFELFHRMQALPGGRDVPMLFLTARSDEIDRVAGLEMGADDYIAKPFSPRELVARVRTILRRVARNAVANGEPAAQRGRMVAGPLELDDERHRVQCGGRPVELSRYEYGILRVLMQRPGRVFTRDELLAKVWQDGSDSFDRTVDAHVKTLRAKLKAVAPGLEPIRTVRGSGYALADDLDGSVRAR